jgi:hypothetical protein
MAVLLFCSLTNAIHAQFDDSYDEISVMLNVQRIGSVEIPAVIYGQTAYLPVKEVFDFLKIKNSSSSNLDSVNGIFITPKASFLIVKSKRVIIYQDKVFNLKVNDLIRTETTLYLKAEYFGLVFGLDCAFNFRSLSIMLSTKIELPAIREMQLEQMRRNVSQLKGEKKADTIIKREFPLFALGMADWSIVATQEKNGVGFLDYLLVVERYYKSSAISTWW